MHHPIIEMEESSDIAPLLRTYVDPGIVYFLDHITVQSRVRITHTVTGAYVIYGSLGPHADDGDTFRDESFCTVIPRGYLRVRIGHNVFRFIDVRMDIETLGVNGRYGILFTSELTYRFLPVVETLKTRVHKLQYVAMGLTR